MKQRKDDKSDKSPVVLKILPKTKLDLNHRNYTYLDREVESLQRCVGHDWSLQFIEYLPLDVMENCAVIVTELIVGIDVCDLLTSKSTILTEIEVVNIIEKIALAIK